MKPVRVAADHWNFETGPGQFITPIGGNILNDEHPVKGTLFDHFDKDDCERRLAAMAGIGLNCLRQAIGVNTVFDPKRGLRAQGLRNWDIFIALAEKYGIYLMPVGGYVGGNDWFDAAKLADFGRSLDESCAFFEAFAGHYAGHPAIWAWDLRNELFFDNKTIFGSDTIFNTSASDGQTIDRQLKDRWPHWLETRYGTVAAMNRAYQADYRNYSDVPGSVRFIEKPFDLAAFDFRNYLNDRGYDWCKRHCDVIRAVAPAHMVVSGNNTWLTPDQDLVLANGFHNRALHDLFDFICFHPYPACQAVPGGRGDPLDHLTDNGEPLRYWINSCIGNARHDYHGKPVVIQEFGWYGGGTSRFIGELPYRSEEQHAEYTRQLCEALIPHVNGFVNWPTMDMPAAADCSNHGGIFTSDARPKALAAVYRDLSARLIGKPAQRARGTTTLSFSLLGLYTSRPYQDQMWDRVHEVISDGQTPDFRFV